MQFEWLIIDGYNVLHTQHELSSLMNINQNKARNKFIRLIEEYCSVITKKTSVTDHLIFASGTSNRHISSMSESIYSKLKKLNLKDSRMEGKNSGWVVIDSGDVIIHLFKVETRKFYNLEKMWSAEIE